jgi:4-hydroxy-tetrahydrodipicolinate synthase
MSVERVRQALIGISGVHVTPYDNSGAIDLALLKTVVGAMAVAGVHNIVSAGNTGEFFALTSDEVVRVHEAAIDAVAGRALVTAAVGRSLIEATATARAARRAGADAIMAHHPLDPFAAPQAQADYFIALAEASELPLVAYVRSDLIAAADLARIAVHPNVAGVKFATANLMLLAECVRATSGSPAVWICGLAEGWAAAFYALGTRGFTSGLVNIDPGRSLAIWKALEAGDFATARRLVDIIAPFEAMRTKFNNGANVTVVKEAMTMLGRPVGPVRLPGLAALDAADRVRLTGVLSDWGLLPVSGSMAAE